MLDGNNQPDDSAPRGKDGLVGGYWIDATQKEWLAKDLAKNRQKPKIVFCHEELHHTPERGSGQGGDASTTNCVIHEFNQARKYADWEEELYGGVHIKYADGYAELPPGPRLGIDVNEEAAKKRPARPFARTRGTLQWPDGSVGDT